MGRGFQGVYERLFNSSAILCCTGHSFVHSFISSFIHASCRHSLTAHWVRGSGDTVGVTTGMVLRGSHFAAEDGQLIAQLTN